jgi:serine/threonine protein kinase
MVQSDDDEVIIEELMLLWDDLQEGGQHVSPADLCSQYPQLIPEVERRVQLLEAIDWIEQSSEMYGTAGTSGNVPHEPKTLSGRYQMELLIGEGGFGQVWRAFDIELERNVALKVPKPGCNDATGLFISEARRVARLKHPSVIPVHDVIQEDGCCFIVSEFVEGGNLRQRISQSLPSPAQATRWAIQVAEALQYAHASGIVHRDVKPANILIDHHQRAILADFGIAHSASKPANISPSAGTLKYMAPEQVMGEQADCRSDIYGLGLVLVEMLTGKLPYRSKNARDLREEIVSGIRLNCRDIPRELSSICEKALKRHPDERFQDVESMAHALAGCLETPRLPISFPKPFAIALLLFLVGFVVATFWCPEAESVVVTNSTEPN